MSLMIFGLSNAPSTFMQIINQCCGQSLVSSQLCSLRIFFYRVPLSNFMSSMYIRRSVSVLRRSVFIIVPWKCFFQPRTLLSVRSGLKSDVFYHRFIPHLTIIMDPITQNVLKD